MSLARRKSCATSPSADVPKPSARSLSTLVESSTDFIGMCDLDGVPFFVNRAGIDDGRPRQPRRGPSHARDVVFLPGRSGHRSLHEFLPSVLHRAMAKSRSASGTSGPATPSGWPTRCWYCLTLPDARRLRDGQPGRDRTKGGSPTTSHAWRRTSPRRIAARTNSWRCWRTNCGSPSPRSATPFARCDGEAPATSDGAIRRTEMLERQVGQMSRLVDDLLDVSRVTRGKIELRTRTDRALARLSTRPSKPRGRCYTSLNHELSVTLPPQPVYLDADPAACAGDRQPAEQRRQVHRQGRPHLADRRAGRRQRR